MAADNVFGRGSPTPFDSHIGSSVIRTPGAIWSLELPRSDRKEGKLGGDSTIIDNSFDQQDFLPDLSEWHWESVEVHDAHDVSEFTRKLLIRSCRSSLFEAS